VPNSVLLEKGGEYSLIVQLKGNKSSLELAREKAVYASGDLFVSMPQKKDLSLTKNLELGDNYTLVVYLCNKNGVRCSENFYPVITPTGEGRTTVKEGARTVRNTVRVEDGLLTVMKW
jgi:hypothetical protein